jgi:hypothetical protein
LVNHQYEINKNGYSRMASSAGKGAASGKSANPFILLIFLTISVDGRLLDG